MSTLDLPEPMLAPPVPIAHRGGVHLPANIGKENSLEAFANAIDLGFQFLETDLRMTKDGVVFAFHDPDLKRTAGRPELFSDLTADEVRALRLAGGARIASLDDLLVEFPDAVFNLDFKEAAGIETGLETIANRNAADRVVIASFSHSRLLQVRKLAPHLLTSASQVEVARMRFGRTLKSGIKPVALQVPEGYRRFPILTERLVGRARDEGMQVHVWTVDDPAKMNSLLDFGVDGIITDRPDVLKEVLISRGEWQG